jgi:cell division protein FtsB
MPTTDQLQGEINAINGAIARHFGYILQNNAQVTVLQQRCARLEAQVKNLQDQLAKVRKG